METRRIRGQLIETFKILKGINKVDPRIWFQLNDNSTRNNGMKLVLLIYRSSLCGYFVSYKVVNVWNQLRVEVVSCQTVDNFKKRLDKIIKNIEF